MTGPLPRPAQYPSLEALVSRRSAALIVAPQTGHGTASSGDTLPTVIMFPHRLHLMLSSALSGGFGHSLLVTLSFMVGRPPFSRRSCRAHRRRSALDDMKCPCISWVVR